MTENTSISITRTETMVPKMAGIAEVSEMFGVSRYFVRKLANSGRINAVRISGRILINVDRFAEDLNSSVLCGELPTSPKKRV